MNFPAARAFLLVLLIISAPLAAQNNRFGVLTGPRPGGGETKINVAEGGVIEAQSDEYYIAQGGVTIEYQDIKLQAYKVTLNHKTRDVTAEGNVIIDQGPTRVSATQAIYNLNSKTGTFFNATGTMNPEVHFSGTQIEKVDDDTFRLTDGVFTSCNLDRPAWSFHVGSAEVNVNDYAHLRDVSFRAKNLPVLYAPRLLWPTKRERSQGFLIPRLHVASSAGSRVELGYFLPFGESVDATVTADVTTEGYYGGGINLRYVPSQNVTLGDVMLYGITDPEPELTTPGIVNDDQAFRWRYRWQHAQDNLPNGFRGVIDIQDFSNLEFFRGFDSDPYLTTLSNIYSSAYLTKNRPRYSLNILADRRELVFIQPRRYEQLPAVQLRLYPQRVANSPLYFGMESSSSYLRTNAVAGTTDTTSYYRTDLYPTLSLQLRTPPWISIRPQVSARGTYYSASLDRDSVTGQTSLSEDSINRFYAQGQVEVVGPSFSRIFNRQIGGFQRFKHVIEPRARYIYTPSGDDAQNRIIRFDSVDTPFLPIVRDSVEYSLTQRLIAKEGGAGGSAREVMSLSLRQTAALSRTATSAGGSSAFAQNDFTPLIATLRVNPYQSITVDANAIMGNVSKQLDQLSLAANLVGTGDRAGKYLSLTWFATYRSPETTLPATSQIRLSSGGNFFRDRFRTDVQISFDAEQGKVLDERYILGGTGSCYGVAVAYRRFQLYRGFQPEMEDTWDVAITLKNVGTIGSLN